jgi:hypothetical protein
MWSAVNGSIPPKNRGAKTSSHKPYIFDPRGYAITAMLKKSPECQISRCKFLFYSKANPSISPEEQSLFNSKTVVKLQCSPEIYSTNYVQQKRISQDQKKSPSNSNCKNTSNSLLLCSNPQ